jgi:hypothetical protein
MHRVDAKPRAPLRSSSADTGGCSHPALSDFNIGWRGVRGSERSAYCRRRICELRASTRTRSSGSKLPMRRAIGRVGDIIELKLLEGCLGLQKNLLKIRKTWAEIKELCGTPPVLSTHSLEVYDTVLLRLIESIHPKDFIELLLTKHLADCTSEIIGYTQSKTLLMERKHRRVGLWRVKNFFKIGRSLYEP